MVCANIRGWPDVVLTPAQIQAAMDDVCRPLPYTPWWAVSTLRPSPRKPSNTGIVRPPEPLSGDIVPDPIPEYPPAISKPPVAAERLGVTVQLDVAAERRRSFWWRLVAKLQFFRS
jgi:hypothetical protein